LKKTIFLLAMLSVGIGLLGFQTGAYYEFEKLFGRSSSVQDSGNHSGPGPINHNSTQGSNNIEVNTIFNYGNGTIRWSNGTKVPKTWTFYNLTLFLTDGNVHSAIFNIAGILEHQILGLNNVEQNSTDYWSLWKFCPTHNAWTLTSVGADEIALSSNGIYGWYYQRQDGTQYAPVAGAPTVTILDIASC
jgi:hypothetical protein